LKRFFDTLFRVNETICKVLLVILVLTVAYVVFGRFVLNQTPRWGEEVGLMAMVWIGMLSASLAIRTESHLKLSLIDLFLHARTIRWIDRVHTVLILAFALLLISQGIRLVEVANLNRLPGLGISSLWFYIVVPLSGIIMALHALERIFRKPEELNMLKPPQSESEE
jgi:TRAP-type C4-dicarboxylate transport system permease small subunit